MTLEETIRLYRRLSATSSIMYKPNSKTLGQIATWLEELKVLRIKNDEFAKYLQKKCDYKSGYDKALEDVVKEFEKIDNNEFAMFSLSLIQEITEKLQKGDKQ